MCHSQPNLIINIIQRRHHHQNVFTMWDVCSFYSANQLNILLWYSSNLLRLLIIITHICNTLCMYPYYTLSYDFTLLAMQFDIFDYILVYYMLSVVFSYILFIHMFCILRGSVHKKCIIFFYIEQFKFWITRHHPIQFKSPAAIQL